MEYHIHMDCQHSLITVLLTLCSYPVSGPHIHCPGDVGEREFGFQPTSQFPVQSIWCTQLGTGRRVCHNIRVIERTHGLMDGRIRLEAHGLYGEHGVGRLIEFTNTRDGACHLIVQVTGDVYIPARVHHILTHLYDTEGGVVILLGYNWRRQRVNVKKHKSTVYAPYIITISD